jgi:Ring finger domain/HYPK UBA domain
MDDCPICYEKVDDSTGHCTLSCKHSFHLACLSKWSNENPNCPMCRHPLGVTEAPAKQLVESDELFFAENMSRFRILTSMPGQGQQGAIIDLIREVLGSEPVQPPPPPRSTRILNIGDGVQVSEEDVALVMEQSAVTRGEAVRALRRYEGDIVNSILMLTSPDAVVPRRPVVRDPTRTESDDQATAWFLQQMFGDSGGYHWNSYSDVMFRMRNGMRGYEYWTHSDFNEIPGKGDGYNSA